MFIISLDSRQVTRERFFKSEFQTGKQIKVKREKTGPVTVFGRDGQDPVFHENLS